MLSSSLSREIGRKSGELGLSVGWMIACFQEDRTEPRARGDVMIRLDRGDRPHLKENSSWNAIGSA